MGFTITSAQRIKGITKTNYYYTTRYRYHLSRRTNSAGVVEYFVRYTRMIYPDKYEYRRDETAWIDARELEIQLTYEQATGNISSTVYTSWKSEFNALDISSDTEPAFSIMQITSENNLNIPNTNCSYYIINGTTTIKTIVSSFSTDATLSLQFTGNTTISHLTSGTGAQISLAGLANFSAVDKNVLHLLYNGTIWTETSRE